MKIDKEIDLYKYSTMRTHSIGACMYTPVSVEELIQAIKECNYNCYFLGGGSNVVFADRVEKPIINLMELNKTLSIDREGLVTVGCSVRIQKLINYCKEFGLGGFEYLYSLPASVGGIVYMNAGRGKAANQRISDWIVSVKYLDLIDLNIKTKEMNQNEWWHRHSPFQDMNIVIVEVTLSTKKSTKEDVQRQIQKRIDHVKQTQDGNKPSCGSVFNGQNRLFSYLLRGKRIGGACYSKHNGNWISNDHNGSGSDVIALVRYAERLYRLIFKDIKKEIKIYK